ncbi:hypothetical protein [Microcoleus sp. OTE_8_concoct_300]|uniref:hypothetical protein n=1 Tax=Microcoleus sp. OTE_8_concoct_300 TaxID=2964710 RepID=UPI00403F82D4
MFKQLLQLFPSLLAAQEKVTQFSRELSNKIFQNFNHDAQHLLPGCYFYAGLQIEVKTFSAYSTFLGEELNYWDWLVYDGFGQVVLKTGVGNTRDDAIALAQSWTVEFLDGKVPYPNSQNVGDENA